MERRGAQGCFRPLAALQRESKQVGVSFEKEGVCQQQWARGDGASEEERGGQGFRLQTRECSKKQVLHQSRRSEGRLQDCVHRFDPQTSPSGLMAGIRSQDGQEQSLD